MNVVPPPLPVSSPPSPSRGRRISCAVAIFLVFVFVGPPVGALAFMLSIALIGMGLKVDLAGLSWIGLFAMIYAVPLSYFIGIGPAAVGGLVVGIRQAFYGSIRWPVAMLIGLGIGIGVMILSGKSMPPGLTDTEHPDYLPVMVITCFIATMVCWAIVRTWHFGPQGRAEAIA